jgi:hypothetical protein
VATLGSFRKLKQQQLEEPAPAPLPLKKPKAIGRNLMIGGVLTDLASIPVVRYGYAKQKALPIMAGSFAGRLGRAALLLGGGYALANMAARERKKEGGYTY